MDEYAIAVREQQEYWPEPPFAAEMQQAAADRHNDFPRD